MIGHKDGSVLNDDSECPGRGSRTPLARARSSSSQPVAVGSAAVIEGLPKLRHSCTRVSRQEGKGARPHG